MSTGKINKRKSVINNSKAAKKTEIYTKPIVSPIAKYDADGNLFCIICKNIIKSYAVWKVHINSKLHKSNVEKAKNINKTTLEKYVHNKSIKSEESSCSNLDSLDIKSKNVEPSKTRAPPNHQDIACTEALPEMFFDNPEADVKIRRAVYTNDQNDEWEKFKLEIKETVAANNIISGEQNNSEVIKEITEISEQMQRWSKVIKLENKLQTIIKKEKLFNDTDKVDENISDDEFDDQLDWRSKKFS